MTNPYEQFATDKKLENEGVRIDYPGYSIIISRAGGSNSRFSKVMTEIARPYRRQIEQQTIDSELSNKLLATAYARSVILGWENLCDENEKIIQFSEDNCIKLLIDLPDLFLDIQKVAGDYTVFKVIEEEIEEKN